MKASDVVKGRFILMVLIPSGGIEEILSFDIPENQFSLWAHCQDEMLRQSMLAANSMTGMNYSGFIMGYRTSDIRDNVKKEMEKMFHLGHVIEMKKEMN